MTDQPVDPAVEALMQKLTRFAVCGDRKGRMLIWPKGEFVGYEDVRALVASLSQQLADARTEIGLDEILLAERQRILKACLCPVHGECVPHVIKQLERLTAAEASKEPWQPISTGPKDGTIVDVWLGDADRHDVAFYCVGDSRRAADWHWKAGKWRPVAGLHAIPVASQPTHWMPKPGAPRD